MGSTSDLQLLTDELRSTLKCPILTPDSNGYATSILRWNDAVPNAAVYFAFACPCLGLAVLTF